MPVQLEFNWDSQEESVSSPPAPLPARQAMPLAVPTLDVQTLQDRIALHANTPVHVHITDNTSNLISVKPASFGKPVQFRLHHMFLQAPAEILEALSAWALRPKTANEGALVDAFIQEHRHLIRKNPKKQRKTRAIGAVHDLGAILATLNQQHFGNSLNVSITWGKMPRNRRRYSIRFGSYYHDQQQIRIHPLLDQAFVPRYFIRYIVFHEMLHAYLGVEESASGRRRIHTKQFNRLEQAYPDYEKAIAWMDHPRNLKRLLRKPRSNALSGSILQMGER